MNQFEARLHLLCPNLLKWLGVNETDEVWHSVHVVRMDGAAGSSGGGGFIVTQQDVTAVVVGERRVSQMQEQHQVGILGRKRAYSSSDILSHPQPFIFLNAAGPT